MTIESTSFSRSSATLCALMLLTPMGCSEEDTSPGPTPPVDAGTDSASDSGSDTGGGDLCLDQISLDTVMELDPEGPDTQIHVNATFDGEGIWVVWNRPDSSSYFDVWAQRLGCDGAPLVSPILRPVQVTLLASNRALDAPAVPCSVTVWLARVLPPAV